MKESELPEMRSAYLPFGDWCYFPRKSLNIVKIAHHPRALWKPVHVSIGLTSRCEKNCDFCYAESSREGGTLWNFENAVKMVESCDRNGVFAVTLGGGEPVLWNDRAAKADFYDLLNVLRSFGCDVSFTTSAVPRIDWARIPPTILPRISLHHHREADFICNEIQTAAACRGSIPAVNILIRKGEIDDLLIAAGKLAKTGVNDFLLIPLKPAGRASHCGAAHVPAEDDIRRLARLFPVPHVKLSSCCHLENQKDTFLGCGAGDWFVSIDEKLRIKSCSFIKTGIVLADFDYQEILNALPFLDRLKCHSRIRPVSSERC